MRSVRWLGLIVLGFGITALIRVAPSFLHAPELIIGESDSPSRVFSSIPPRDPISPHNQITPKNISSHLAPLVADETAYFMVLFSTLNPMHTNHSFATFIKATGHGPNFKSLTYIRSNTISWLPDDGTLDPSGPAEKGRNFTLRETLHEALQHGNPVSAFGPFRITPRLYNKALTQIRRLESGAVKFKATETEERKSGLALDAALAITDIEATNGLAPIGSADGERANRKIIHHFSPDLITPSKTYGSLLDRLGIRDFRVERRLLEAVK